MNRRSFLTSLAITPFAGFMLKKRRKLILGKVETGRWTGRNNFKPVYHPSYLPKSYVDRYIQKMWMHAHNYGMSPQYFKNRYL